jgi:hypothetical protein
MPADNDTASDKSVTPPPKGEGGSARRARVLGRERGGAEEGAVGGGGRARTLTHAEGTASASILSRISGVFFVFLVWRVRPLSYFFFFFECGSMRLECST